jgi:hypothetical protein
LIGKRFYHGTARLRPNAWHPTGKNLHRTQAVVAQRFEIEGI